MSKPVPIPFEFWIDHLTVSIPLNRGYWLARWLVLACDRSGIDYPGEVGISTPEGGSRYKGYSDGFDLNWGSSLVAHIASGGANAGWTTVELHGSFCCRAPFSFWYRLHSFLRSQKFAARNSGYRKGRGSHVTRCDYALDDFEGRITPAQVYALYDLEPTLFRTKRMPQRQVVGHLNTDQGAVVSGRRGLTCYIGSFDSSKRLRCYEKGPEIGDCDSPWVRHEVVYTSADRDLPLEMILPEEWAPRFKAAFPLCEILWPNNATPEMISMRKRSAAESMRAQIVRTMRAIFTQYGKALGELRRHVPDYLLLSLLSSHAPWKQAEKFAGVNQIELFNGLKNFCTWRETFGDAARVSGEFEKWIERSE